MTGFSLAEIDLVLDDAKEAKTDPTAPADIVPEPSASVVSRRGDIWMLGRHRLLCGDAREVADYRALLNGDIVDLVFTEAMPTNLSHPEDLVFREGRFVYNKYGPRSSDVEAQLLTFVRLRELCFLQAEWEQRQCPEDRPVSVARALPILINDYYLPKRKRLSEDQVLFRMYKISILKKRELKQQIEATAAQLGLRNCPWGITGPAEPLFLALAKEIRKIK